MPGKPTPIKVLGLVGNMQFLFDVSNFSGYYTMAVVGAHGLQNNDSLFNGFAARIFQKDKVTPVKKLTMGDADGREYIDGKDGYNVRLQVYRSNNMVYVAAMYSLKKENLSLPTSDKYFKSFVINKTVDAGPQTFTLATPPWE